MKNVRERVEAGEDPKPEEHDGFAELLMNEIDIASICPFPNVPVSGPGNFMRRQRNRRRGWTWSEGKRLARVRW